jgi:hypothetical protein
MFYSEPFMERRRRVDKIFVTELHEVFHEFMSSALTTFVNATLIGYQCSQKFELRRNFKGFSPPLCYNCGLHFGDWIPTNMHFVSSNFTSRTFQRLISLF